MDPRQVKDRLNYRMTLRPSSLWSLYAFRTVLQTILDLEFTVGCRALLREETNSILWMDRAGDLCWPAWDPEVVVIRKEICILEVERGLVVQRGQAVEVVAEVYSLLNICFLVCPSLIKA